nr:T9SS type A sorting domain-containing protein [Chitinophagaceae bacterium]
LLKAEVLQGPPPSRSLPAGITKVSEIRHYRVTRVGNSGVDFTITLPYGLDDGVSDPANLTIVKDNGSNAWVDIGGTPSGPAPGRIMSGVFNGFSDFVLANKTGGTNPLPVTWLEFKAEAVQADARLEWQTANESNCQSYEVERSTDGTRFALIGDATCRNLAAPQTYRYTDINPGKGTFYYRLKQVDKDGKFEYSAVRKVSFGEDAIIKVYPNPVRDVMQMASVPGNSDIRLFDATGRLVLQTRSAQPVTQMQVGHLSSGIYELMITTITGERFVQRIQILR